MAITIINDDDIHNAVLRHINENMEEVVRNAVDEYEKKLREEVSKIVLNMSSYYSLERNGKDIIIKVKFNERDTKAL